ncbi:MAG: phosphodiester glycosidase family protein [Candidatus Marinimicrobia bacterium]|nr:phosphodiester glycosidase family protein [FCB group bacterium]MBL7025210.1 phosphodiester glycosidase family protein [Candidatus Neomarinimicrobiota bacterium]
MFIGRLLLMGLVVLGMTACTTFMPGTESAEKRLGKSLVDKGVVVYNSDPYDITIVGFTGNFEILYEPETPLTLKQAGEKHEYRYMINGSYFHASREHAGWLSLFGTQHASLLDDKQLSHMAVFDPALGYIDFPSLDLWDTTMTSKATVEFQTGPLVVEANTIDTLSINGAINGKSAHLRTLLAYTEEDDMRYFIIARRIGSLEKMGEHLLSLPLFKGKALWVVNLDGGSSTALYSRDYPELNFNINRPLPILLGLK